MSADAIIVAVCWVLIGVSVAAVLWGARTAYLGRAGRPYLFLVFGECDCGWTMAAREGSRWPRCPECGSQVMPPQGDPRRRLAVTGRLLPEQQALSQARRGGYAR